MGAHESSQVLAHLIAPHPLCNSPDRRSKKRREELVYLEKEITNFFNYLNEKEKNKEEKRTCGSVENTSKFRIPKFQY